MIKLMIMLASGWLLLIPPVQNTIEPPGVKVDDKRPYPEWQQRGAYDTARECELARTRVEAPAWNYFANQREEVQGWNKRLEALVAKGKENWDDQDWDVLRQYAEYLRRHNSKGDALAQANLKAR